MSLSKKKGFTLTEITVVLGVIGLVLGAIWNSYSQARANYRNNQAWNDIETVLLNLHNLTLRDPGLLGEHFTGASVGCTGSNTIPAGQPNAGQQSYFNQTTGSSPADDLVAMNVYPSDMLMTVGGVKSAVSPWGGGVGSLVVQSLMTNGSCNANGSTDSSAGAIAGQSNTLSFTFYNLLASDCVVTIFSHAQMLAKFGLQQVCTGLNDGLCTGGQYFGPGVDPTSSITLSNVITWCSVSNKIKTSDYMSVNLILAWPPSF